MNDHGKTSVRKKIAASSWGAPSDPSCYGNLEFNCEKIDAFIESHNKKNPEQKISYTHFFIKLFGKSFIKAPDANGVFAFGQFVPFKGVNLNTVVDINKKNLVTIPINNCELLKFSQIREQLNKRVKDIKKNKDLETNEFMKKMSLLPTPFVSALLQFSTFVSYYLGIDFAPLKLKKYAFGNIVLTNVSSYKIYNTFAPLVNFSHSSLVAVICRPFMKPVVNEEGEIVPRKVINLNVTFDHRYGDGGMLNLILEELYRLIDNTHELLD